jgi:DNA-binding winged helix-turn-helix (wHTH) protein
VGQSFLPERAGWYRFGPFEADTGKIELRKGGLRIRLERKPWQLILYLLERPGEPVGRADIQRELWPAGTFVDFELGLNVAIRKLRVALGGSAEEPKYIETVAGHGYRRVPQATGGCPIHSRTLRMSGRCVPLASLIVGR